MGIYLDYNASSPIDERVLDKMIEVYRGVIGNADSRTHDYGDAARKVVENARLQVASILGISKDEVFFTSGATESNNIVIQGLREYAETTGKKHIITTTIEHKAVLETCRFMESLGFDVDYVSPDNSGRVDAKEVLSRIRNDTLLVAIMHVNNETGIIQPVKEIGEQLADKEVLFHVDATQSFGKLVEELRVVKYDTLAMSAHKIYGPQGVGALAMRKKRYKLPPIRNILYGGQQEHGIRPGTVPIALIAGLGEACRIAEKEYSANAEIAKNIKSVVLDMLENSGLNYMLNGATDYCVDTTINVAIIGVASEALMLATKEYCAISNGSACTSNSYTPSYVLSSMGLDEERIKSSIRISWGERTAIDEVREQFGYLLEIAKGLVF